MVCQCAGDQPGTSSVACVPSVCCWAEDLSTQSQPPSSFGVEDLKRELGLSGCSPQSSAVSLAFPCFNLLCKGAGRAAVASCGQGATAGGSPHAGWPQGARRELSCCVPFAVMALVPSQIGPGSLDISLFFGEWRRNMGMACLLLLALDFPLWAVAAALQSRGVSKTNPTAPWKEETRFIASSSDLYSRLCTAQGWICAVVALQGRYLFSSLSHGLYCSTVPSPSAGFICP